jgi:hypothetical protein
MRTCSRDRRPSVISITCTRVTLLSCRAARTALFERCRRCAAAEKLDTVLLSHIQNGGHPACRRAMAIMSYDCRIRTSALTARCIHAPANKAQSKKWCVNGGSYARVKPDLIACIKYSPSAPPPPQPSPSSLSDRIILRATALGGQVQPLGLWRAE